MSSERSDVGDMCDALVLQLVDDDQRPDQDRVSREERGRAITLVLVT